MTTVTGLTAARMQQIEANSIVDGSVVGDNLILEKQSGATIDAGNVRGPQGDQGPAGSTAPDYQTIIERDGAVHYYPLDQANGLNDVLAGYNLTAFGGLVAGTVDGPFDDANGATLFDATGKYAESSAAGMLAAGVPGAVSGDGWVYLTVNQEGRFFAVGRPADVGGHSVGIADASGSDFTGAGNVLRIEISGNSHYYEATHQLFDIQAAGRWYHIGFGRFGTSMELFLDGRPAVLVATGTNSGAAVPSSLRVGSALTNARVAHFAVYKRRLRAAEFVAHASYRTLRP
jgi:hypothetical protein